MHGGASRLQFPPTGRIPPAADDLEGRLERVPRDLRSPGSTLR